jgi:hypothetical protein
MMVDLTNPSEPWLSVLEDLKKEVADTRERLEKLIANRDRVPSKLVSAGQVAQAKQLSEAIRQANIQLLNAVNDRRATIKRVSSLLDQTITIWLQQGDLFRNELAEKIREFESINGVPESGNSQPGAVASA